MYPKTGAGRSSRMMMLIAGLIAISTLLFIAGAAIERNAHSNEAPAAHQEAANTGSVTSGEAAEAAGGVKTPESIAKATPIAAAGESGESTGTQQGEAAHNEATTADATTVSGVSAGSPRTTSSGAASESTESSSETVLGIDIENPWIVGAIVVGWLLLLAALFRFTRVALGAVAVAAAASTIFDIAEVLYQVNRANTLVAIIALLVAGGHAAIAVLSVLALLRGNKQAVTQPV